MPREKGSRDRAAADKNKTRTLERLAQELGGQLAVLLVRKVSKGRRGSLATIIALSTVLYAALIGGEISNKPNHGKLRATEAHVERGV